MSDQRDLDEFLAGMYDSLRRHEDLLHELSVEMMAVRGAVTRLPEAAQAYDKQRALALQQLSAGHAAQLRLYDEIIRRLRRSG